MNKLLNKVITSVLFSISTLPIVAFGDCNDALNEVIQIIKNSNDPENLTESEYSNIVDVMSEGCFSKTIQGNKDHQIFVFFRGKTKYQLYADNLNKLTFTYNNVKKEIVSKDYDEEKKEVIYRGDANDFNFQRVDFFTNDMQYYGDNTVFTPEEVDVAVFLSKLSKITTKYFSNGYTYTAVLPNEQYPSHPSIVISTDDYTDSNDISFAENSADINFNTLVLTTGTFTYENDVSYIDFHNTNQTNLYANFTFGVNAHNFVHKLNFDNTSITNVPNQKNRECAYRYYIEGYVKYITCLFDNIDVNYGLPKYNHVATEQYRITKIEGNACAPTKFGVNKCNDSSCTSYSPISTSLTIKDNEEISSISSDNNGVFYLSPSSSTKTVEILKNDGDKVFCGDNSTAQNSCQFEITSCSAKTASYLQYVNESNNSFAIDLSDANEMTDFKVSSVDLVFKNNGSNNLNLAIKDGNGTNTQLSLVPNAEKTLNLPVKTTYVDNKTRLTPDFKIDSPILPEDSLVITDITLNYQSTSEEQNIIPISIKPESGDKFDLLAVNTPIAVCAKVTNTDNTNDSVLIAGQEYLFDSYSVGCSDNGCPTSLDAITLTELCTNNPNKVSINSNSFSRKVSQGFKLLNPNKISDWAEKPFVEDNANFITVDETTKDNATTTVPLKFKEISSESSLLPLKEQKNVPLNLTESAGWFSFASEPINNEISQEKPIYYFSPVYAVVPESFAVTKLWINASDALYLNSVITRENADFYNLTSRDNRPIDNSSCPAYFGETLTFSGVLSGLDHNSNIIKNISELYIGDQTDHVLETFFVKATTDASNNIKVSKINYETPKTLKLDSSEVGNWFNKNYQNIFDKSGFQFRNTITTYKSADPESPTEYYPAGTSKISFCIPKNDFSSGCGNKHEILSHNNVAKSFEKTSEQLSYEGISDSNKLIMFADNTPLTLNYGRLASLTVQGELSIVRAPVSIQYFNQGRWLVNNNDSCTILKLRQDDDSVKEKGNLTFDKDISDYTNYGLKIKAVSNNDIELSTECRGTESSTECVSGNDSTVWINNQAGTFENGYLWIKADSKCLGNSDCNVAFQLKNSGDLGNNPLNYLYDSQLSNGGFIFKKNHGSERIIQRRDIFN